MGSISPIISPLSVITFMGQPKACQVFFSNAMASHVAAQMVHNISPTADFPEIAEFPFPLPKSYILGAQKVGSCDVATIITSLYV